MGTCDHPYGPGLKPARPFHFISLPRFGPFSATAGGMFVLPMRVGWVLERQATQRWSQLVSAGWTIYPHG